MENLRILIITDNTEGKRIARELKELETKVIETKINKILLAKKKEEETVLLIINLDEFSIEKIISELKKQQIPDNWLKFIFLKSKILKDVSHGEFNIYHLEFLQRPVRFSEFLLLVEKSILTEKFKLMLKEVSVELKDKGEAMENLYHVMRKKLFDKNANSADIFDKIIKMQKKLDDKTYKMQKSIQKFSMHRQKNLIVENSEQPENILESILPHKSPKNKEVLKDLHDSNINMEEALIDAQNRIIELEKELGEKAMNGIS